MLACAARAMVLDGAEQVHLKVRDTREGGEFVPTRAARAMYTALGFAPCMEPREQWYLAQEGQSYWVAETSDLLQRAEGLEPLPTDVRWLSTRDVTCRKGGAGAWYEHAAHAAMRAEHAAPRGDGAVPTQDLVPLKGVKRCFYFLVPRRELAPSETAGAEDSTSMEIEPARGVEPQLAAPRQAAEAAAVAVEAAGFSDEPQWEADGEAWEEAWAAETEVMAAAEAAEKELLREEEELQRDAWQEAAEEHERAEAECEAAWRAEAERTSDAGGEQAAEAAAHIEYAERMEEALREAIQRHVVLRCFLRYEGMERAARGTGLPSWRLRVVLWWTWRRVRATLLTRPPHGWH